MKKNLTVDKLPLVKVVKKSKKETNEQREEYLMKILLKVECNEFLYYALGTYNLNKRQLAINKYNKAVDKVNDIMTEISSLYDKSILMFLLGRLNINEDLVRYCIAPYLSKDEHVLKLHEKRTIHKNTVYNDEEHAYLWLKAGLIDEIQYLDYL